MIRVSTCILNHASVQSPHAYLSSSSHIGHIGERVAFVFSIDTEDIHD